MKSNSLQGKAQRNQGQIRKHEQTSRAGIAEQNSQVVEIAACKETP